MPLPRRLHPALSYTTTTSFLPNFYISEFNPTPPSLTLSYHHHSAPHPPISLKNAKLEGLNVAMDSSQYFVDEDGRFPDDSMYIDENEYMAYSLNLGADTGSACPTPALSRRASKLRLHIDPVRRAGVQGRGEEGDCGICFEHAQAPTRTRCCGAIFCAEHISARLHGHACRSDSPASVSTPALSPSSSTSSSSYASLSASSSSSSPNDEDYAFPAAALRSVLDLQSLRTRTSNEKSPWNNSDLDTDESADPDTKETLRSFLETRNILLALARAAGCVLVVGILAGRGHWV
ncbi:hypothetical protein C8R44DRAFT_864403 [Mycena epipterygia]|nr:hypothetical protein C8R44DRAFT_864403 [Mycena epipterygia]